MAVNEQTSSFEPKPFGRYVLLDKLAVGGMAEIYKAKTYGVDGFEKVLAVKRILPHCAADKEFITMLVDEAKLTVLLSHANIVQVFDLGKVGDDYFISMEFIFGTNLREVLNRFREMEERFPEELAVYVMSEICKGLDYAHRKTDHQGNPLNIVHRDISPQNILISFEGEAKIVDFGIAKAAMNVSHTMAGILKGKIAYMSPEQALGKPINHQTDIFSAGVLLYEMMTGDKLFSGETQFEVLNQIRTTRVNTMMLPDFIQGPLKAILAKALAYNLKDRYQSAGDFQLDLTKFLYSSYVDFSPRQLSSLVTKLFADQLKKKEQPVTIDEKTRSVMVQQAAAQQNIMVHGPAKAAETAGAHITEKSTAPSVRTEAPVEKKGSKTPLFAAGGAVAAIVLGLLGYQFFMKEKPPPTPPVSIQEKAPSTPSVGTGEEIGSLQIVSEPSGAKIFVNGRDTGQVSPATISKLALGDEYQVSLRKENYKEFSKAYAVTSDQPVGVTATLEPTAAGSIEINSTPPGARIIVNDQDMGMTTPNRLTGLEIQKSYSLKLSLANHFDWSSAVEVKNFDPVKLQANLNPMPASAPAAAPGAVQPAVASQPTPATSLLGSIRISSEPTGAKVFLNGQNMGMVTPTTLDKLQGGQKANLRLTKDGYKEWTRSLTVEAGKATPLTASLNKMEMQPPSPPVQEQPTPQEAAPEEAPVGGKPGTLTINSEPSGAEVYINSELKGTTPAKVANVNPGNVKLILLKEGFMRYSTNVKLSPGENKSLGTIQLGDQFGEVSIKSSPPRATVVFDGEEIGARTPVTIRRVPRDRAHSLKVKLDGYKVWDSNVNLQNEANKKYDVLLEKE